MLRVLRCFRLSPLGYFLVELRTLLLRRRDGWFERKHL